MLADKLKAPIELHMNLAVVKSMKCSAYMITNTSLPYMSFHPSAKGQLLPLQPGSWQGVMREVAYAKYLYHAPRLWSGVTDTEIDQRQMEGKHTNQSIKPDLCRQLLCMLSSGTM
jgi:hypothetical protein